MNYTIRVSLCWIAFANKSVCAPMRSTQLAKSQLAKAAALLRDLAYTGGRGKPGGTGDGNPISRTHP
jgi:hypothetical protein